MQGDPSAAFGLGQPLGSFLEAIAREHPAPAAGPAAAIALALAAGLAELTARISDEPDLAARARGLRDQVAPLAQEDAEAYEAFLRTPDDPAARERTIELPLRMTEHAAEIGETAALASERGKASVRADAAAGALLAEAAARATANLVFVNLGDASDERRELARRHAERAAAAAARALPDRL